MGRGAFCKSCGIRWFTPNLILEVFVGMRQGVSLALALLCVLGSGTSPFAARRQRECVPGDATRYATMDILGPLRGYSRHILRGLRLILCAKRE